MDPIALTFMTIFGIISIIIIFAVMLEQKEKEKKEMEERKKILNDLNSDDKLYSMPFAFCVPKNIDINASEFDYLDKILVDEDEFFNEFHEIVKFLQDKVPENHIKLIGFIHDLIKIKHLVYSNIIVLQRKLSASIKYDDYGFLEFDKRPYVIADFVDKHKLIGFDRWYGSSKGTNSIKAAGFFCDIALQVSLERIEMQRFDVFNPSDAPTNGLQFEHWVASSLMKYGFEATPTQGSGDQGLDVLATIDGVQIGIQCKRWKKAVGNKAVQEIIAAQQFFGFDYMVVITTSKYTPSAIELANRSGVNLFTHHEIPKIREKLNLGTSNLNRTKVDDFSVSRRYLADFFAGPLVNKVPFSIDKSPFYTDISLLGPIDNPDDWVKVCYDRDKVKSIDDYVLNFGKKFPSYL